MPFHDWSDYNGIAFSIVTRTGRQIFGCLNKQGFKMGRISDKKIGKLLLFAWSFLDALFKGLKGRCINRKVTKLG